MQDNLEARYLAEDTSGKPPTDRPLYLTLTTLARFSLHLKCIILKVCHTFELLQYEMGIYIVDECDIACSSSAFVLDRGCCRFKNSFS